MYLIPSRSFDAWSDTPLYIGDTHVAEANVEMICGVVPDDEVEADSMLAADRSLLYGLSSERQ